ncbi:MAG: aspartate 1-decarboxylase [Phycisphaerae bacterium]
MLLKMLRAKIHRAAVTQSQVDYVGSITIDQDLLDASGILAGEDVLVADLNNGHRFHTYVMRGAGGSGTVCVNGAAAKLAAVGDRIIIMAFAYVTPDEAKGLKPAIVFVDDKNRPKSAK